VSYRAPMPWAEAHELIQAEGLTQGQLATLMGMSRPHLNRILSGRRPPEPQTQALVEYLGQLFELMRACQALHQIVPAAKRRNKTWKRVKLTMLKVEALMDAKHGGQLMKEVEAPPARGFTN